MTGAASAGASPAKTGDLAIVLTGGGARAAYQVGFLRCIARHVPDLHFPILTGVSAGAINAAYLAAHPGTQAEAIVALTDLWRGLSVERVFRVDTPTLVSNVARWGIRLVSGGGPIAPRVRGLLDTAPLRETLASSFDLPGGGFPLIQERLERRELWALAIVTSSYTTGQSVIWIGGRDLQEWERPSRRSRQARIVLDHVMASGAIPLFFPAVRLDSGWYGDGGIKLTAPCSPAIHLGATRVLALSTRYDATREEAEKPKIEGYPPPLQICGQLLNAVFLDDLHRDAQNLRRVNKLIADLPPEKWNGLRPIELMVVRPSRDLGTLVSDYERRLPRVFRHLTRSLGSRETTSPDVLSLLAFDPEYVGALIDIGETDAESHATEIRAFLRAPDRAG